jgi:hypothetical protein
LHRRKTVHQHTIAVNSLPLAKNYAKVAGLLGKVQNRPLPHKIAPLSGRCAQIALPLVFDDTDCQYRQFGIDELKPFILIQPDDMIYVYQYDIPIDGIDF